MLNTPTVVKNVFYSILRYDTTSLLQPSSTQQEITLYFFENQEISPKTLSIEDFVDRTTRIQ